MFSSSLSGEIEELNFTALWEGIQMLGKLVGLAFQPSPPFLARCPHDDERIVVCGRKLVLRANPKKVFLTNPPPQWLALSGCLRYIEKVLVLFISPCWSDLRVTVVTLTCRTLEHLKRSKKWPPEVK